MKTPFVIVLLALTFVCNSAAQDSIVVGGIDGLDPLDTAQHYPVLLALSGGGARGLASIGVLRAFQERQISVVAIAGTSIGGIVGGLSACGYSPDQLANIIRKTDFSVLFASRPSRLSMFLSQRQERDRHLLSVRFDGFTPRIPQGLTAGQQLSTMLSELTSRAVYHAGGDFSRLQIPFKTVTTDMVTGKMVVLSSGSLADAMRATMAFPLAFTGLEFEEQLLMDGGMVAPVPVDIVRGMCDTVSFTVAVNTTSPLMSKDKLVTPVDIANQATSIMTRDKLLAELGKADYVIEPTPDEYTGSDFEKKDSIIEDGYRIGLVAADSIVARLQRRMDTSLLHITDLRYAGCDSATIELLKSSLLDKRMTRAVLVKVLKQTVVQTGVFRMSCRVAAVPRDAKRVGPVMPVRLEIEAQRALPLAGTKFVFSGVTLYAESTLIQQMDLHDSLVTSNALKRGLDRLVNMYHVDGHDLADIRRVAVDPQLRVVTISFDEAIVARIDVEKNEHARDWLVRSYCSLKPGEAYSVYRASEGIGNLYGTDLFERVTIEPQSTSTGAVAVISVHEKPSTQVRLGWHWDDEYQSEEFAELLNDNVMGVGVEYLLHAQYGQDKQLYTAELKANRIFSTYLTARIQLYHERFDRRLFEVTDAPIGVRQEITSGATFRIGQQIERLGTVSAGLTAEELTYHDSRYPEANKFGLRELNFESLVESFDRWPLPRSGKNFSMELTFAGKYLGGDVEYTRFFSSLESYFPLGKWLTYHPKASVGLSRAGLPPSEQFYAGGLHSFSGLRTNQVNGDKMLLLNQELRLKLPLRLYLFARYDIGEGYNTTEQIKLRNLRQGFGCSLAADTPIGPVEFGYGVTNHDADRFYFNAGLAF